MTLPCKFPGESVTFLGPFDLLLCGIDVPLSYSHTGRYIILSASLSFKMYY